MFDVSVMVTTIFGDATLSSLVGRYKRPVGTCCLSIQGRRASNVEKRCDIGTATKRRSAGNRFRRNVGT